MFCGKYLPDLVKHIQNYETKFKRSALFQNEKESIIREQLKKNEKKKGLISEITTLNHVKQTRRR